MLGYGFDIFLKKFLHVMIGGTILVAAFGLIFSFALCSGVKDDPASIRADIYNTFQIELPQEWNKLYFNQGTLGGLSGEGTAYYVFKATEGTEDFFAEFSSLKDQAFEERLDETAEKFESCGRPIQAEYMYDTERPYEWFMKSIDNDVVGSVLSMLYQSDNVYIFAQY